MTRDDDRREGSELAAGPARDTELTDRLHLVPLSQTDLAPLHEIYSDPDTWRHLPSARHRDLASSRTYIDDVERAWRHDGLASWAIRLRRADGALPAGAFIGCGGVMVNELDVWNLGYRLAPAAWGRGFATEVCRAALRRAHDVAPDRPVTARALAANPASIRVLEKAGLTLEWRGRGLRGGARRAAGSPLPETIDLERVIVADRPLDDALLDALVELG